METDLEHREIFSSILTIPSIGENVAAALHRLHIREVKDFLFHFPSNVILKKINPALRFLVGGEQITSMVTIEEVSPPQKFSRRHPFKIICSNETGFISLVYFNYQPSYLLKTIKVGQQKIISGKVEKFNNELTMPHPEFVLNASEVSQVPAQSVIYPLTYGIVSKQISKYVDFAISKLHFPEWHETNLLNEKNWVSFKESIYQIHQGNSLGLECKFKERLSFDELLANQIGLGLIRKSRHRQIGNALNFHGHKAKKLLEILGFSLTNGQKQVLAEIESEQKSPHRMMRLLQGDVGSGKTLVALIFALNSVESGFQNAFMAPTDILASQHFEWISKNCAGLANVAILTGKIKGKKRTECLAKLEKGEIDILIGTHALFQERVIFKNLGSIVIDEQHRFGVNQRENLAKKGNSPDILSMSATPIPRTLTMTHYGDMEISILNEKPAGRMPIDTRIISTAKIDEIIASLKNLLQKGEKIYWICPLIEEAEKDEEKNFEKEDLAAAKARFETLNRHFAGQVGLVHGKMKSLEKDAVMEKFINNEIQILVATTVIEVGVDVPDATIMIIEQAERFGLSQLHQLRGRVGRGSKASNCLLLYGPQISQIGLQRLKIMKESNDGFYIAEQDLALRGSGDILGTKQSGLMEFKIADFANDFFHCQKLLSQAKDVATKIINEDPSLNSKHQKFRNLLKVFDHEVTNTPKN